MITRDQAVDELQYAQWDGGDERAHSMADDVLVRIIREVLGWDDVADAYESVPKWFA